VKGRLSKPPFISCNVTNVYALTVPSLAILNRVQ
jgi:hypothetical protein